MAVFNFFTLSLLPPVVEITIFEIFCSASSLPEKERTFGVFYELYFPTKIVEVAFVVFFFFLELLLHRCMKDHHLSF